MTGTIVIIDGTISSVALRDAESGCAPTESVPNQITRTSLNRTGRTLPMEAPNLSDACITNLRPTTINSRRAGR